MQSLEKFLLKQAEELEKFKAEVAAGTELGDIPGLELKLVHSVLYGWRHMGMRLVDWDAFKQWALTEGNTLPIFACEGKYKGFYPSIPDKKDWEGAELGPEGDMIITYSSIMRQHRIMVYHRHYRLEFPVALSNPTPYIPTALYAGYSDRYHGQKQIEAWSKTHAGERQYLRMGVDRQSAEMETLELFANLEGEVTPHRFGY